MGLGRLDARERAVEPVATLEVEARRASNTQLLPRVDALLRDAGISREQLACVCVGRGPGSFTGVRIAMATAKGIAQALGVALVGVSSLDAVAWRAWAAGTRGALAVVADAMRREVYPVRYTLDDAGVQRLEADRVVKAQVAAEELAGEGDAAGADGAAAGELSLTGDGLKKYAELFAPAGALLPEELWAPAGTGLLLALQVARGRGRPVRRGASQPGFSAAGVHASVRRRGKRAHSPGEKRPEEPGHGRAGRGAAPRSTRHHARHGRAQRARR